MSEHVATTPNRLIPSPKVRKALYGVAAAVGAVVVAYGLVTQDQLDAWLSVLSSIVTALPLVLAFVNTPKEKQDARKEA